MSVYGFHITTDAGVCQATQHSVRVESRPGGKWAVMVLDDTSDPNTAYVTTISSSAVDPVELLRLALNQYREHRPLEPGLFEVPQ